MKGVYLTLPSCLYTLSFMNACFQIGLNGRVPVPSEKRFLISF